MKNKARVYFIGIGGIGMSALAQYYLAKGHKVSGSDLAPSEITSVLKSKGAAVFIGPHSAKNLCLKCHFKHNSRENELNSQKIPCLKWHFKQSGKTLKNKQNLL